MTVAPDDIILIGVWSGNVGMQCGSNLFAIWYIEDLEDLEDLRGSMRVRLE